MFTLVASYRKRSTQTGRRTGPISDSRTECKKSVAQTYSFVPLGIARQSLRNALASSTPRACTIIDRQQHWPLPRTIRYRRSLVAMSPSEPAWGGSSSQRVS